MLTSFFYHTQGIRGFRYVKILFEAGRVIAHFTRSNTTNVTSCPVCKSRNVRVYTENKTRDILAIPCGSMKVVLRISVERIKCLDCKAFPRVQLPFCSNKNVCYTRSLARYVVSLRKHMPICAVAKLTDLHWDTVKNIEKNMLKKKYRRISLKSVEYLGIDEVYLGKKIGYITVVRDVVNGDVLYVGKGKGGDALKEFNHRIRTRSRQIKGVCIDMSNAYSAWCRKILPFADIIYDHFHVIKLMNEKLNKLRRSTFKNLEKEQQKDLKNTRFLLIKNFEDLDKDEVAKLNKLRVVYEDLGTASMLKEYLRNIYKLADSADGAEHSFLDWCDKAYASGVACLKTMANNITQRLKGLVAYWTHMKLTSASQEGFNNKIGWLTRQAYGYRDQEYLFLKIFDLPNVSTVKKL